MTKAAALYSFFSSFGIPAYEENSIYSMKNAPAFPYLTYEIQTDSFSEYDAALSFSLWYSSESWVSANAKSAEISAYIGSGGKVIPCDGGYILIQRAHPFAQNMGDDSDDMIKRITHNISVRYYTND